MPGGAIGPGLIIHNFSGILVLAKKIGHSCTLNQGVSIMNVRGVGRATIGNNCYFSFADRGLIEDYEMLFLGLNR